MAGNLWGADVDQLRTLARQFSKTADLLLQQSTQLSGQINNTPAWKGQDAEHFRSDWNGSHRALLQKTAARLKQESKLLLTNAEEQDKASSTGGAGGPGGTGGSGGQSTGVPGSVGGPGTGRPGTENPWGPDWLADPDSPFRDGWDIYGLTKAFPNLRAGLFDIAAMLHKSRISDFLDPAAWRAFQNSNEFSKFFNMSNSLFEGKFHEVLDLAEGSNAFKYLDGFSKGLGVVGVGLDSLDAFNNFQEGDYGSAAYSTTKALLGAGSFLPPPAGTACMVASGALALYDNVPIVHDSVNYVGDKIADGAEAVGGAISDGVDAVGDFFGF
ncbi:WXG100 family type VII secretion target [Arthrobacter sp. KFRI-F3372]|nr:WXG100 family type VII secretion target [Arthrobacter sp. KFRI-F3372]